MNPNPTEPGSCLIVETRADRPGLVRVHVCESCPTHPPQRPDQQPEQLDSSARPAEKAETSGPQRTSPQSPILRYAAVFDAIEIARMHAQTALSPYMVDADSGLYRIDPVSAVAAIDTIDLRHRCLYLDPLIAADPRLHRESVRRRTRQRLVARIWTLVGLLAIVILILFAQIPGL